MKSILIEGKVWFRFEMEEIQDLVYGLISAKVDDKLHLQDNIEYLPVSRQMELRRNINRYQALIEQLSQGRAY